VPDANFFWQQTPSSLSSAALASGIGDWSKELWWSDLIDKSPLFHQMSGKPQDADEAFTIPKNGMAPGIRFYNGGPSINERMVYQLGNTPTWLSGFDNFDYSGSDELRHFQYKPRWAVLPVAMSIEEIEANKHRARITDLMREKVEIAFEVFAEDIGDNVINSDGTDNGGKKMLGLAGIIRSDPTASWTVGGWDVSANSNLRNKYNADIARAPTAGAAGDFLVDGRADVRDMYGVTYEAVGTKRHKVIGASRYVFNLWVEALDSRDVVTFQDFSKGGGRGGPGGTRTAEDGYMAIMYNQAKVIQDPHIPNGTAAAYNNMLLFLTFGCFRLAINSNWFLKARPWTPHKGQLVESMEIVFSGTCVAGQPSALGILDGYNNPS